MKIIDLTRLIAEDMPMYPGTDASSLDPVGAVDELLNHKAILKTSNTVFLENLCNLEEIGNELFTLCALPLHTKNADGAPARIIAMID